MVQKEYRAYIFSIQLNFPSFIAARPPKLTKKLLSPVAQPCTAHIITHAKFFMKIAFLKLTIYIYMYNYIYIMGRRKIEEHQIRNLMKTAGGTTYIVSMPIDVIRKLKWQAGQKLVVTKYGDGILIKDWQKG
jgi:hypothetical protein